MACTLEGALIVVVFFVCVWPSMTARFLLILARFLWIPAGFLWFPAKLLAGINFKGSEVSRCTFVCGREVVLPFTGTLSSPAG